MTAVGTAAAATTFTPAKIMVRKAKLLLGWTRLERVKGIEPSSVAWEATQ